MWHALQLIPPCIQYNITDCKGVCKVRDLYVIHVHFVSSAYQPSCDSKWSHVVKTHNAKLCGRSKLWDVVIKWPQGIWLLINLLSPATMISVHWKSIAICAVSYCRKAIRCIIASTFGLYIFTVWGGNKSHILHLVYLYYQPLGACVQYLSLSNESTWWCQICIMHVTLHSCFHGANCSDSILVIKVGKMVNWWRGNCAVMTKKWNNCKF